MGKGQVGKCEMVLCMRSMCTNMSIEAWLSFYNLFSSKDTVMFRASTEGDREGV